MITIYPAETNNGVATSWIPLTTVYTPPASCYDVYKDSQGMLMAFDPNYGLDVDSNVQCAPLAETTWWAQTRLGWWGKGHTDASLGPMTCPHQWTTVATSVKDIYSTAAMCCPSGYVLVSDNSSAIEGDCISSVTRGMVLTYGNTLVTKTTSWFVKTTTITEQSSLVGAIAMVGWNVNSPATRTLSSSPRPAKADANASSSTTAAAILGRSSSVPTSTYTTSGGNMRPSATIESSSPVSEGPSQGATIGNASGVALGIIGIASLLAATYLLIRRGRKRKSLDATTSPPLHTIALYQSQELHHDSFKPEIHEQYVRTWPAELYGS